MHIQGDVVKIISRIADGEPSECWLWQSNVGSGGYGTMRIGSRTDDSRRMVQPHRFVLELKLGRPIAEGKVAAHTCDVKLCCNPLHLFELTQGGNVLDCYQKRRRPSGEKHHWAKLTDAQASEIRARYAAGGVYQYDLAEEYDVSQPNISLIVRGINRKHDGVAH